jgi:hypothetical protein
MSALQAALGTSSRSLAPTDHFRVYRRCLKSREAVANSRAPLAASRIHASRRGLPLGTRAGRSPRAALRAPRPSDGWPGIFSGAVISLHACLGVALDAGEDNSEVVDDLDGGHPSLFSLDKLSAQVQRVGVFAPVLHSAQRYCSPI